MRATLERRYDGPIPPADPAHLPVPAALRARLFQRLASEARHQTACHRARLPAERALGDARLRRLNGDLGTYRIFGLAWRTP